MNTVGRDATMFAEVQQRLLLDIKKTVNPNPV